MKLQGIVQVRVCDRLPRTRGKAAAGIGLRFLLLDPPGFPSSEPRALPAVRRCCFSVLGTAPNCYLCRSWYPIACRLSRPPVLPARPTGAPGVRSSLPPHTAGSLHPPSTAPSTAMCNRHLTSWSLLTQLYRPPASYRGCSTGALLHPRFYRPPLSSQPGYLPWCRWGAASSLPQPTVTLDSCRL